MDCQKLISVIIPTYNRGYIIKDCIDSVLNQTYRNIEVIVVDDCSTDNTETVVKSMNDSRIKYFKLDKNRKACFARNFGFQKATGEYIAFQDSDDIWHFDKLKKEVHLMEETGADIVFCGMNRTEGTKTFLFPGQDIDVSQNFFEQELRKNLISTQTILLKKYVMSTVQFDVDFRKFQDWDFAIRVSKEYKGAYLPEALVDSVVQSDSISSQTSHFEATMKIFEKYKTDIISRPHIYARYLQVFGDCFRHVDSKKAKAYYAESAKQEWNVKVFIKFLCSTLGIKRL